MTKKKVKEMVNVEREMKRARAKKGKVTWKVWMVEMKMMVMIEIKTKMMVKIMVMMMISEHCVVGNGTGQ